KAGWTKDEIQGLSGSLNEASAAAIKTEKDQYTANQGKLARPGEEKIASNKQLADINTSQTTLDTQARDKTLTERKTAAEEQQYNDQQAALAAYKDLIGGQYGGSLNALHEGARNYPNLTPEAR